MQFIKLLTGRNIAIATMIAIPLAIFIDSRPENVIVYEAEAKEVPVMIELSYTKERVQELIAMEFADAPIMLKVAKCESGFLQHAYNPTNDSHDGGVFQISQKFHGKEMEALGLDPYDVQDNITYARILYDKKGLQPWTASKKCWSR